VTSAKLIIGDSLTVLRTLPDDSVDLVLTSPPYLALRSYLRADDPAKQHEMGSESTPGEFIDALLDVTEELARVLAPHGSIAIELGDTYCADMETEILTQRGWLTADALTVDDIALTLNPLSRLAEWQPVQAVNRFPAVPRSMLSMEGDRGHSSLTTANHRWLTERRVQTGGIGQSRPGEQNGRGNLTQSQVEEIRGRYAAGNVKQTTLAEEYGVIQATISKITTGRTWTKEPVESSGAREWVSGETTSDELISEDRIQVAALVANLPTEPKWSDALVEAVAWYWTEGNDRTKYGKARGLFITQSERVHPRSCDRIRRCLTVLYGPPVKKLQGKKRGNPDDASPQWREDRSRLKTDGAVNWKLNGAAADVIRLHAPDKVVRPEWLTELTQAQLDLFVMASVEADGHERRNEISLSQSNVGDGSVVARRRAESFQIAAIISGKYATIREHMTSTSDRPERKVSGPSHPAWSVHVGSKYYFKPGRTRQEWVIHDGEVWCPSTANGSWLARRKGAPFFTGNSGSGGAGGDYNEGGLRDDAPKFSGSAMSYRKSAVRNRSLTDWPQAKSLTMIPESYRWALAYGRNPFNGRETDPWRVRNVVRHFRPNPPVGALGDKVRPATSEWVVACKSRTRFFDLDAVRTATDEPVQTTRVGMASAGKGISGGDSGNPDKLRLSNNPAGAPPLDWWDDDDLEWKDAAGFIQPTSGYPGAHYATFSPKVVARLIKPMCPAKVCRTCGEPSRLITDSTKWVKRETDPLINDGGKGGGAHGDRCASPTTTGWTECDCSDDNNPARGLLGKWRPGVVLDPFAGSGTTLQVATGHGFDAVGIDLDARNADLCQSRVGMFLEVVEPPKVAA
jgi:hypothetical protein